MKTGYEEYLEKIEARYDRLISEGKMTNSSRVIPVNVALKPKQWVLPSEEAISILSGAKNIALTKCQCRELAHKCAAPLEVCFHLDEFALKTVERGKGRLISIEEAKEALALAAKSGLVHLTLYDPSRRVFALCSCCPCCCHDFFLLKEKGRRELVAHSEFIARTDGEKCDNCGACVAPCPFDARAVEGGLFLFEEKNCYGCGVCVPACPKGAIEMDRR